jgi:Cu2+-containing amine oxidase|tara:strand:- start:79 stop:267 length:189 start_codon:yes stop_codon:yes gene_type:complete
LERSILFVAYRSVVATVEAFLCIHPTRMGNSYHHRNIHQKRALLVFARPLVVFGPFELMKNN